MKIFLKTMSVFTDNNSFPIFAHSFSFCFFSFYHIYRLLKNYAVRCASNKIISNTYSENNRNLETGIIENKNTDKRNFFKAVNYAFKKISFYVSTYFNGYVILERVHIKRASKIIANIITERKIESSLS